MLTKTEYLLGKVAEECNEVAQRCMKALRFGMLEVQPGQERNNVERLLLEWYDLKAAMIMLIEEQEEKWYPVHGVDIPFPDQAIATSRSRVIKYMEYSQSLGILEPENGI